MRNDNNLYRYYFDFKKNHASEQSKKVRRKEKKEDMYRITGFGIAGISATIFGYIFVLASTVLALVFGILALIPASPFIERNLGVGLFLLVGSVVVPVIGCTSGLIGILVGFLFGSPCLCYSLARGQDLDFV